MKLSEIFSQLAFGELAQSGVVSATKDDIDSTKYGQITAHVNMGLIALYRRFLIKENRVRIALQAGVYSYVLASNADTTFVEASDISVFADDINKIERVYTDSGIELDLNNEADVYSCFTPTVNILRVPNTIVNKESGLPADYITNNLDIVYRASHPRITYIPLGFQPSCVDIELPYTYLEALLYYIASRVNNPVGMTNEFHAGNNFAAKYEKACQAIEIANTRIDHSRQSSRLVSNGWV